MSAEEAEFWVVYSGQVKEILQDILRKAKKLGKLRRFANAVLEMDRRLKRDPFGLGELIGTFRATKLLLHVGFVRPLRIHFAIHQERRLVFVGKIVAVTDLEEL